MKSDGKKTTKSATESSNHMDFPFNFCGLVVGLVGVGFSPNVKTVTAKFFNVNKTTTKICRNNKPFSNILFVIEYNHN